jgi:type II secretory pathway component PulC
MKGKIWTRFTTKLKKTTPESRVKNEAPPRVEGKFSGLWSWALPLLLGGLSGWFGMVCLEVSLDERSQRARPVSEAFASVTARNSEAMSMTAFLTNNPFKITPMPVQDEEEESMMNSDAPSPIEGSLAAAVIRWTMPDLGVLLEDRGKQYMVLLETSFDIYTLEKVNYRQAVFRKGEERVVKDLLYSVASAAGAQQASSAPPLTPNKDAGIAQQVIAANPSKGVRGEISRELINQLMANPFDELKKVRLRPASNEQGLQIQWIDKGSILAQLGVQKDDVIRSINGIPFRNMTDITNSINSLMNSDRFDVEVARSGSPTSMQYAVR